MYCKQNNIMKESALRIGQPLINHVYLIFTIHIYKCVCVSVCVCDVYVHTHNYRYIYDTYLYICIYIDSYTCAYINS